MYDKLSVVALAKSRMDYVAKRQEVLAENIANANTPKYIPKDLKEFDFKSALTQATTGNAPTGPVTLTNAKHIAPVMQDPRVVIDTKKTFESSADGNSVVLEEQLAKISQAKTSYEVAAGLFQKQFRLIKLSLGK